MDILLDTHTFLWWITDSPKLSATARDRIADPGRAAYWSAASSWETAVKYALGRLPVPEPPGRYLAPHLKKNRIRSLAVNDRHAFAAGALPPHHRDPFDRMLIAQAMIERLTIVTADPRFADYDVEVAW